MTKQLIAVFALMGTLTFAEDLKKAETKEAPAMMTEVQSRDIMIVQLQDSILALRGQITDRDKQIIELTKQLQDQSRSNTIKAICDDKKIPASECSIDPTSGQVTRKPPVVAAK